MLYKTILFGKLGIAGLRRKLEVLREVYFWGAFIINSAMTFFMVYIERISYCLLHDEVFN